MAIGVPCGTLDEQSVRRLWWAALDILQEKILLPLNLKKGLWIASPLPALYEQKLLDQLKGWVWTPETLTFNHSTNAGLLPPSSIRTIQSNDFSDSGRFKRLNLRKEDGDDPLLIIITKELQIAIALAGKPAERNLIIRSDPEALTDILHLLDQRLNFEKPELANELRESLADLGQLKSNKDFAQQASFITEKLQSISVDMTRILEVEITDRDWRRYNKGERGIFVRKMLGFREKSRLASIAKKYQEDSKFREYVTSYLEEFKELMLLNTKRGEDSLLQTVFLSSDIGKVYMILSQALGRDA